MDVIKALKDIRDLQLQVQKDEERLNQLREEVGVSTSKIRVAPSRGSVVPDIMAEMIVKIDYIIGERLKRKVDIELRILEVEQAVDALPAGPRKVIRLRYFEGDSWRQVMRTTGYSYTRCKDFHVAALLELENSSTRNT